MKFLTILFIVLIFITISSSVYSRGEDLKTLFDNGDLNKNKLMDAGELKKLSEEMKNPITTTQANEMIKRYDGNKDSQITYNEFEYMMR